MSPDYVQCLLIVHSQGNTSIIMNPVERAQINVYAVVPRVEFYDRIHQIFAELDINILTGPPIDPLLFEAAKSRGVTDHEIVLEKDKLFDRSVPLVVYADNQRRNLVQVIFGALCCVKDLRTWYVRFRNATDAIGLLNEDNFNTIEQLWAGSNNLIRLSHCPTFSNKYIRENQPRVEYFRKYSGKQVIKQLGKLNLELIEKDTQDAELAFGAVDLDRLEQLKSLLKWGACVYYRSSVDLRREDLVTGDLVRDLLIRSVTQNSIRCLGFLTDLDRSQQTNLSVLRHAAFHSAETTLPTFQFTLNSRGLNLDFILDPKFRKVLCPVRLVKQRVINHVSLVRAANLDVNATFVQKAQRCLGDGNGLEELLRHLESPPEELHVRLVEQWSTGAGPQTLRCNDILNLDVVRIVDFFRNGAPLASSLHPVVRTFLKLDPPLEEHVSNYQFMIKSKLRKSFVRTELTKKAIPMFNFLFEPNLPEEMIYHIVDYLSNVELLSFVNICKLPN